jgi:hypothetical protein
MVFPVAEEVLAWDSAQALPGLAARTIIRARLPKMGKIIRQVIVNPSSRFKVMGISDQAFYKNIKPSQGESRRRAGGRWPGAGF